MRSSRAPVFTQASCFSGYPSGATWRYSGSPSRAASCASRGLVSGSAPTARAALTTNSSGVLTLPPSVPGAQKSGDVKIARSTWRDRKSTRLNSSHGYISYAVFCLKKKKKKDKKIDHKTYTKQENIDTSRRNVRDHTQQR